MSGPEKDILAVTLANASTLASMVSEDFVLAIVAAYLVGKQAGKDAA